MGILASRKESACELMATRTVRENFATTEWFEKPKALNFIKFSNAKIYQ